VSVGDQLTHPTAMDEDKMQRAWNAVRIVRTSAKELEPVVAQAVNAIVDMYEQQKLAEIPALDRALTIMVGTLTAMTSAREMLGWLETATRE
jgi:hypothetical protein